ncbi:Trihelix transcription factor ASIL2 [Zea mays]|uniref:Trihelix transcription factor ASIL2 n=1 Tax=Zea mays TaxID=4577 RepID=A0A3L6F8H7_MAIZE|nr:Trihelix transcription factor ASIL2 [Zea mays]
MADEPPPPALARKSAPAQPWSHVETMHLIDAYEERWTALRRGQLKAHQWEEVATEVAARCAANPGVIAQRKTGTQCRHKLEKLRKRYRTEGARPVTSLWPYFRRMDRLERGVLAAYPAAASSPPAADGDEEEDEEDVQEEEEGEELVPRNNTRSINGIIREFGTGLAPRHPQLQLQLHPPPSSITPSTAPPRKRVAYEAFQAKDEAVAVEMTRRGGSGWAVAQLSVVVRDFGEGVMRLERRRMEVQWEIERGWQEADARHARMLKDALRQFRDTAAAAAACVLPPKKARRDHGDS